MDYMVKSKYIPQIKAEFLLKYAGICVFKLYKWLTL